MADLWHGLVVSGVLAALAAGSVERTSFVCGQISTNNFGMSGGAISFLRAATTTMYVDYNTVTTSIRFQMNGDPAQAFFSRVQLEDSTPGTFQTFTSASATFSDLGLGQKQWSWSPSSLWSAANNGQTKRIILVF
jgi:hypothetical protein